MKINLADLDLDPIIDKIAEALEGRNDLKSDSRTYAALITFGLAGLVDLGFKHKDIVDGFQEILIRVAKISKMLKMKSEDFPGGLQ